MAQGCGFENNGQCGVKLANSTYRSQPYLVDAFLNGGTLLLDGCRIEGYAGFAGKMKLAKVGGKGLVTLRASGDRANVDVPGDINVKVA